MSRSVALAAMAALLTAVVPVFRIAGAAAAEDQLTYLVRHTQSGQYLAPDGWGPGVLASHHAGEIAAWHVAPLADGSNQLVNVVTGRYLDATGGRNGNEVGLAVSPSDGSAWMFQDTPGGTSITAGGEYLVADGYKVRTSTQVGANAVWELIEVDPVEPRWVTLTNEATGNKLAVTGPADDGLVVTSDTGGQTPATVRWRLVQQVTTSHKCERHPDWSVPNDLNPAWGDTSRLTTCHVLLSRVTGRALDADSADSNWAVTTSADVAHDAYWIASDVADGATITLRNAAVDRLLADAAGNAVTTGSLDATARWVLGATEGDCDYVGGVSVDSHQPGTTIDTTPTGTKTGSFTLYGTAPAGTTSVTVAVAGETALADLERSECADGWAIEVGVPETSTQIFTVTASGPTGTTNATVDLTMIAATADDTILTPTFVDTPQFHDLLVAYDDTTGMLTFTGDVAGELDPGDGLVGGQTPVAPNGYLRIVLASTFDGTNTVVETRQAGLTEFVRQIHIDIDGATADTADMLAASGGPTVDFGSTDTDLEPAAFAAAEPQASGVPIGDNAELTLEMNVDPSASFELDIDWEQACWICPIWTPTVDTFAFEVGLSVGAQAEFVYNGAELFERTANFGPPLADVTFATITIPTPIAVPIVVVFEADSQPFYDISVNAAARVQLDLTLNITVGYEHTGEEGERGAYRDASVEGGGPQLDFDVGILATVAVGVEVDIEAQLFGQTGLEIEARPQLELEAVGDVIRQEIPWELKLVVPFAGGVDIEIGLGPLNWEHELTLQFAELSLTLFAGTITFGTDLRASLTGPPGAFPGQTFAYVLTVENTGSGTASGVVATFTLPASGEFVSSDRPGTPTDPASGGTYTVDLGSMSAGEVSTVAIRWRAPDDDGQILKLDASVTADNAESVGPLSSVVAVGMEGRCNPCGAVSGGTGLRNRDHGSIEISGMPTGAVVTRAVLIWGVLYTGAAPRDTITFQGTQVSADLSADVSGNLCWGDAATIGYAADVTALVNGDGVYEITDPVNGVVRVDSNPAGVLPYTDGASLLVFYVGGGANSQVISDFTYTTNTGGGIVRDFDGVSSLGLPGATLTVAGPDGQNNGSETFVVSGSGSITLSNTWNGSAPQDGPSFTIGNLWDNDTYDVSSVVPAGQSTLQFAHTGGTDCVGVGAAVLEVPQG